MLCARWPAPTFPCHVSQDCFCVHTSPRTLDTRAFIHSRGAHTNAHQVTHANRHKRATKKKSPMLRYVAYEVYMVSGTVRLHIGNSQTFTTHREQHTRSTTEGDGHARCKGPTSTERADARCGVVKAVPNMSTRCDSKLCESFVQRTSRVEMMWGEAIGL